MEIQTVFIYSFLTMIVIYIILLIDRRYISNKEDEGDILKISILCGLINWMVILYFICRMENDIPDLMTRNYEIMTGNL